MSPTTFGWLVLAFPLAGALVIALGWRALPGKLPGWIGLVGGRGFGAFRLPMEQCAYGALHHAGALTKSLTASAARRTSLPASNVPTRPGVTLTRSASRAISNLLAWSMLASRCSTTR